MNSRLSKTGAPLRGVQQQKFLSARINLLMMVIFTAINTILAVLDGSFYLLFSATLPYDFAANGMYFSGNYPEEYYIDWTEIWGNMEFFGTTFLIVMLAISAINILLYLACFFFSKKEKVAWLIVATVLFVLDTFYLFFMWGFSPDSLLDYLFHAWVLYYLISGVVAGFKLKNMPAEDPAVIEGDYVVEMASAEEGQTALSNEIPDLPEIPEQKSDDDKSGDGEQ